MKWLNPMIFLMQTVVQPEWGRTGHAPHEKNVLRILLMLQINFQLLEN